MDYNKIISSKENVLIEFYASWCPHCQRMTPIVDGIKHKFDKTVSVVQFDIDKFEALSDSQKVETVPTFIMYVNGKEVWRQSGEMTSETLEQKIKTAIGATA